MSTFNLSNLEKLSLLDAPRSPSPPHPHGFPKIQFDPWTDEMYNDPTIVIPYEVLLGNLLNYGTDNLDDETYHFITHRNPTEQQKDSIFRFFKPTLAEIINIPGSAKKVNSDFDGYSATYPPFKPICRKDDPRAILVGIRDLTDPLFLAKRDAILQECREVLGDEYDDSICPHCGRIEPCVTNTISDPKLEEQLYEFSDDDSVFSFEEEYLKCLNHLGKGEI